MVTEYKVGRTSYFRAETTDENGKVTSRRDVRIRLRTSTSIDGKTHYLLYNDQMKVIPGTWEYLNEHIMGYADNTRKARAYSLRYLFSYMAIRCTSLQRFTISEVQGYIQLLKGISTADDSQQGLKLRGNGTINMHLEVMRDFAQFMGYDNRCFTETSPARFFVTPSDGMQPESADTTRYAYALDEYHDDGLAPRYISEAEYRTLRKSFQDEGDLTGVLLVDLMYLYGLRIGEALGLTIEDVREEIAKGEYIFCLLLRNRQHGKTWQSSKNLPHPENQIEYSRSSYRKATQTVVIDEDTYSQILQYIETVHAAAMKKPDIYSRSLADIVDRKSFEGSENHYLFLNQWGSPLTGQAWNKRIRRHFTANGIDIDHGSRKTNLSHRLRHGFAMYQVQHGMKELTLAAMMRHRSPQSIMAYYNPTAQEERQLKEEFQDHLRREIFEKE